MLSEAEPLWPISRTSSAKQPMPDPDSIGFPNRHAVFGASSPAIRGAAYDKVVGYPFPNPSPPFGFQLCLELGINFLGDDCGRKKALSRVAGRDPDRQRAPRSDGEALTAAKGTAQTILVQRPFELLAIFAVAATRRSSACAMKCPRLSFAPLLLAGPAAKLPKRARWDRPWHHAPNIGDARKTPVRKVRPPGGRSGFAVADGRGRSRLLGSTRPEGVPALFERRLSRQNLPPGY